MPPVQRAGWLPSILGRSILNGIHQNSPRDMTDDLTPTSKTADGTHKLVARADKTYHPGEGAMDPSSINMRGLYALFAILGAALVLASIWFFFWAKNGGFVWKKNDWDEYKSTVLRRKGPDGRTLSYATRSTRLGGGSIAGGKSFFGSDRYTVADTEPTYSDETATQITEKDPERKRKRNLRDKFRRKHRHEKYEGEADADVRAYRKEKPAQIGGINREADGTFFGSDYDTSAPPTHYNQSEMSEVRDYAYEPTRHSRNNSRSRRDFSFIPGTESSMSQSTNERTTREPSARRHNRRRERRRAPPTSSSHSRQSSPRKRESRGHYTEPLDFSSNSQQSRSEYQYSNVGTEEEDLGTISYHHPIPGLSKGYRRDGARSRRRDSLSDSDGEETRYS
ncbi:uncharacterized protein BDV17DRAFT_106325 [Aspergillus undulatus]|uniref:uncharacterized protein n=1 Tax=Aspergillus undulatus TaxID=1810928 RepID=UPI003CCCFFA8